MYLLEEQDKRKSSRSASPKHQVFYGIDVAKAPCYTWKFWVLMLFQSSTQYFYKAVMCFHFTCTEKKKRMDNSRNAAILRKGDIKCKHNATKKQMKKLSFSFIRNKGNRLCSSCLGPRVSLYGIQPGSST